MSGETNENNVFMYGLTDLSLTIGAREWIPLKINSLGNLQVNVVNAAGTIIDSGSTAADNVTAPTVALSVRSFAYAWDGTNFDRIRVSPISSDALTAATLGGALTCQSIGHVFNETSFDRVRGNTEGTVLASAARTASVNSADLINYNSRGLHLIINVSALAATPSIIATIQGKCPISGTYYTILAGVAITTTGINIIKVYPGISAVVGASASDLLPRTWRVAMTHGDADSITYSVAFALVR